MGVAMTKVAMVARMKVVSFMLMLILDGGVVVGLVLKFCGSVLA